MFVLNSSTVYLLLIRLFITADVVVVDMVSFIHSNL